MRKNANRKDLVGMDGVRAKGHDKRDVFLNDTKQGFTMEVTGK